MNVKERRQGREEAFRLLFAADQNPTELDEVIAVENEFRDIGDAAWGFACELARGAWAERPAIDAELDRLAVGWTVPRMAAADRALLRLAAHELRGRDDIPPAVTINEVVELAKRYGTDESPRFINGILGSLARKLAGSTEPSE